MSYTYAACPFIHPPNPSPDKTRAGARTTPETRTGKKRREVHNIVHRSILVVLLLLPYVAGGRWCAQRPDEHPSSRGLAHGPAQRGSCSSGNSAGSSGAGDIPTNSCFSSGCLSWCCCADNTRWSDGSFACCPGRPGCPGCPGAATGSAGRCHPRHCPTDGEEKRDRGSNR